MMDGEVMIIGVFLGVLLTVLALMLVWLGYCIGKEGK